MGLELANHTPAVNTSFTEYITPTQHIFAINEIGINEVHKIFHSLNSNRGSGLDGISCKLLKEAAPVIVS